MSLLLEALKRSAAEGVGEHTNLSEQSLIFSDELEELELHVDIGEIEEHVSEDQDTASPEPPLVAASQIFPSKPPEKSSHLLWLLIVLVVLLLLGISWLTYGVFTPQLLVEKIDKQQIVAIVQEPAPTSVVSPVVEVTTPEVVGVKAKIEPKTIPQRPAKNKKISIVRSTQRDDLLAHLQKGYREYQQGNYAASRTDYRRALQQDGKNRDALLGLAANSMRQAQSDAVYLQQAEQFYWKLLELDPRDAAARAGLAALDEQYARQSSVASLKEAIQQRPQVAPLHFSLANKYAYQRHWSHAQAAYFKAFSLVPDNADYAFNLAVSLDRLGQSSTALQYYQQALDLATRGPHAISLSTLHKRMQYLQGAH